MNENNQNFRKSKLFSLSFTGQLKRGEEETLKVAVKVLKECATREVREDFRREVDIMCSFDHDNILSLIGVVTRGTYM